MVTVGFVDVNTIDFIDRYQCFRNILSPSLGLKSQC